MNWKTIRLELASTEEFPQGSASRALLVRVPLDEQGAIDIAAVERNPTQATVRRFWASEPDQYGLVESVDGGWILRYPRANGRSVMRLGSEPLRLNHRLTIEDAHGRQLPFRVAAIQNLGPFGSGGP